MRSIYKNFDYKLLFYFYPLFFVLCLTQVMGIVPPYFPGTGFAAWPFRLIIIYLGMKAFMSNSQRSSLITVFFIYSTFTILGYLFNNRPFGLYVVDLVSYVTPMLFAYIALDKKDKSEKYYIVFLYSIIICFVFGFYLHFIRPTWYQVALTATYNDRWYTMTNYDYESVADSFRYSSIFLTSYAISHFSIFALSISVTLLLKGGYGKKWLFVVFALISFIAAIISLHRVAMFSCVLILSIFLLYDFRHGKNLSGFTFWLITIILIVLFYFSTSELFDQVIQRFNAMGTSDTFDESRTNQSVTVLKDWNNYIFGEGIGSMGADARKLGFSGISDGNYIKILVEEGIVGFGIYILLILKTLYRGLKYYKYYSVEFSMILGISIAMIGSNSLVMPFYILPFWYAIGRIWNKDYLKHLKATNNHI